MIDIKFLTENIELIKKKMKDRGSDVDVDMVIELNARRKALVAQHDEARYQQKTVSAGFRVKGIDDKQKQKLRQETTAMASRVKGLDEQIRTLDARIRDMLLVIPNPPADDVPVGRDETENVEVRRWGKAPGFAFKPKEHWEIGERLGMMDFKAAAKISGSRFVLYRGMGARLERALASFMLDLHTQEHGYEEVFPPFLVTAESMTGTGQLPKFGEEAYRTQDNLYLIPTAEVPVTNMYRGEILSGADLPLKYAAYSACFRREAGSHGKDVRGIIRLHQFQKVELVQFVMPEDSFKELESLTIDAQEVLKRLGLHHRVIQLSTGDLGFSAAKCYDIEVWMPGQDKFREISSCSNCLAFQARRANIRFRRQPGAKPEFVHTLNGSGVAIGRTIAAILENYQQANGSVIVPEALRPYMRGIERIENK